MTDEPQEQPAELLRTPGVPQASNAVTPANPSPTLRETEEVEIKKVADKENGRGGRRPGAGRPNQTLAALIEGGKFDWMNRRHRELLLHEDVEGDEELRRLQELYRPYQRCGIRSSASWIARSFEDRVRELAEVR